MGISQTFAKLTKWYEVTLADWPWVRSATITAPLGGAVYYLNDKLPSDLKIDLAQANIYVIFACAIIAVYLLLVAVLFNAKLITERQLRAAEDGFRYDNRGTLFHGTQPAIAFRVVTFRGMLEGLASPLEPSHARNALFHTGMRASVDFAQRLPDLYDLNVHRLKGGNRWVDLSFPEKLYKWTDYDSATGWGIIAARVDGNQIVITVTHYNDLFGQPSLFSWFLAGYCNTVIQTILAAEKRPYRGLRTLRCRQILDAQTETVKFIYEMS